jgi:hypothetical protein
MARSSGSAAADFCCFFPSLLGLKDCPKRRAVSKLHNFTTQKTVLFCGCVFVNTSVRKTELTMMVTFIIGLFLPLLRPYSLRVNDLDFIH